MSCSIIYQLFYMYIQYVYLAALWVIQHYFTFNHNLQQLRTMTFYNNLLYPC